jgi:hypothetical protein
MLMAKDAARNEFSESSIGTKILVICSDLAYRQLVVHSYLKEPGAPGYTEEIRAEI